jgi:DNA-binding CsgD family transcriptional regulator
VVLAGAMKLSLTHSIYDISTCATPDDVAASVKKLSVELGCSGVGCYRGIISQKPYIWSFTPEWLKTEYAINWSKKLPHRIISDLKVQVFGPGVEKPENRNSHPVAIEMENGMAEAGIFATIAVPVHSPILAKRAAFSFHSPERGGRFQLFLDEHRSTLTMIAHTAGLRIQQLLDEEEALSVKLSPREREVLLWLSRGLRNAQIAEQLWLSVAAVDLYLANARRKLGVATREQALVKAVMLGLITP